MAKKSKRLKPAKKSKRLKRAKKEDRISDLPDHLIQHILSFLPSAKQAIRTGILSKRWHKQWTQVPVLIFDSFGMSHKNFINFVDNTLSLHQSSKINTFHLRYDPHPFQNYFEKDPNFDEQIRFATTKQVEDLSLSRRCWGYPFLPEFLFNATSLVKLRIFRYSFNLVKKVNWACLKALNLISCKFPIQGLEHILSGSPLLEELELVYRDRRWFHEQFHKLVIATQSLKKLVLEYLYFDILDISCPNLEQLSLTRLETDDPKQLGQAIKNVLSNCLLLESLIVYNNNRLHLPVIASQSLKRLVICNMDKGGDSFELSCQKLEELTLSGFIDITNVNLRKFPSLLCATLAFETPLLTHETRNSFKDILQLFKHVKELRIGKFMFEMMTGFAVGDPPFPLSIKSLILDCTIEQSLSGIIWLLQNFPVLETFVFSMFFSDCFSNDMADLDGFIENYWSSNHCLLSHLRRIKIYAIPQQDKKPTRVLNFIQFLLNNARVLENMTVVLTKDHHEQYSLEVSQKLFGFTRWSNHATIELISECS